MSEVQIAIIDQEDTQITLAVPGVQGPSGAISSGGSANQVFYKVSGTNYDAGWTFIGNANVDAAAAIAGTKISPNFGSQATVTTGTNTAASFIPTSATIPSNGIYLPGANQVGVATNGTGRLFVNNTGIGVGIAANRSIDVYRGDAGQAILRLSDVDSRNVELRSPDGTGNQGSIGTVTNHDFIGFTGNTERLRLTSTGTLNFKGAGTAGSTQAVSFNGSAPINSMVLDSSGRLGIGSSLPDELLHLRKASSFAIKLDDTTNVHYIAAIVTANNYGNGSTAGQLYLRSPSGIGFTGNGGSSTGMVLDSSNRVGIGTTSPDTVLTLNVPTVTTGFDKLLRFYRNQVGGYGSSDVSQYYNSGSDYGLSIGLGQTSEANGNTAITFSRTTSTTGDIRFISSGQEGMRLDSSRRLLVGTSTARSKFQISTGFGNVTPVHQFEFNSQTYNGLSITHNAGATTCPAVLAFGKSRGSSVDSYTAVASGDALGWLDFYGADGTNMVRAATISVEVDGTPGANDMPGRLVFSTTADGSASPTERMRINAGGNILFGCTGLPSASVEGLVITGTSSGNFSSSGAVSTAYNHLLFLNSNGIVGSISTNASATAYNTSSDYRLKENVAPVTDGIARLQQLKPSRFNFIADPDRVVDGFIAHEVQAIVPEAITGEKDAVDDDNNPKYQGIDQSKLVPLLTAALQEAIARIETLETEVAALKGA